MTTTEEYEADVTARFSECVRKNGTERGKRGYISCRSKVSMDKKLGRVGVAQPIAEQLRRHNLLGPPLILMEHFFCARCHVL
jgi:hypothetical protein